MIATTSLAAHQPDTRAPQERAVLEYIRENSGCTREQIADDTHIRLSAVCGRVNALLKCGAIYQHGKRFTEGHRHAYCLWAHPEQQELI